MPILILIQQYEIVADVLEAPFLYQAIIVSRTPSLKNQLGQLDAIRARDGMVIIHHCLVSHMHEGVKAQLAREPV